MDELSAFKYILAKTMVQHEPEATNKIMHTMHVEAQKANNEDGEAIEGQQLMFLCGW